MRAILLHDCFAVAGIPADKLVEAHGTFETATCTKCHTKYNGTDIEASFFTLYLKNRY